MLLSELRLAVTIALHRTNPAWLLNRFQHLVKASVNLVNCCIERPKIVGGPFHGGTHLVHIGGHGDHTAVQGGDLAAHDLHMTAEPLQRGCQSPQGGSSSRWCSMIGIVRRGGDTGRLLGFCEPSSSFILSVEMDLRVI